jgi:predicted  nucleic acid-binding Zn-ribbon protein
MSEIDNVIIEHLKALRSEVGALRSDMHEEFKDLKSRMSSLESSMVSVKRELTHGEETDARQQLSLDRLAERIDRIERRLELI